MENTRTSIWAYIVDVIKSFREVKSSEQSIEDLEDISEKYCEGVKVTPKELKELKKSLAKLEGKKQLAEPEINNGRAELVSRCRAGNTGGSQGKTIVNSNEVKTAEKPDNELVI